MVVTLYTNSGDTRQLNKNLAVVATISNCQINDTCTILRPVLRFELSASYLAANYVYIPNFNRYYYITDITILNGNQTEITGHCDVLMSFWNSFKNSPCTAGRSSSNYDDYIDDPMVTIKETYRTESRRLSGEFTPTASGSNHYVLTIGGME